MLNMIKNLSYKDSEEIELLDKNSVLDETNINEFIVKATTFINEKYKLFCDDINEIKANVKDMTLKCETFKDEIERCYIVNSFTLNPVIRTIDKSIVIDTIEKIKAEEDVFDPNISYTILKELLFRSNAPFWDCCKAPEQFSTKVKIVTNSENRKILSDNRCSIAESIIAIADDAMEIKDIIVKYLLNTKSVSDMNICMGTIVRILNMYRKYVQVYMKSFMEIDCIMNNAAESLTESASKEDAVQYIKELKEMIPKIREFYDDFKYKDVIVPRKKKIEKMTEYMIGALDRKYTLKIPIYKVNGTSSDVKDIVEEKFIKKLDHIVDQYPNFILMTPNFDDDSDMFIYITLKEPFGDNEDRKDRENQSNKDLSMNESALNTDDKQKLSDDEFGLPELRAYPLTDEEHIRKAIQFFGYCKPENKTMLANNIIKAIIKKDLVGKVKISKDNKFREKYFPEWMTFDDAKLYRDGNNYKIMNSDNEEIETGTLAESAILDFII